MNTATAFCKEGREGGSMQIESLLHSGAWSKIKGYLCSYHIIYTTSKINVTQLYGTLARTVFAVIISPAGTTKQVLAFTALPTHHHRGRGMDRQLLLHTQTTAQATAPPVPSVLQVPPVISRYTNQLAN